MIACDTSWYTYVYTYIHIYIYIYIYSHSHLHTYIYTYSCVICICMKMGRVSQRPKHGRKWTPPQLTCRTALVRNGAFSGLVKTPCAAYAATATTPKYSEQIQVCIVGRGCRGGIPKPQPSCKGSRFGVFRAEGFFAVTV